MSVAIDRAAGTATVNGVVYEIGREYGTPEIRWRQVYPRGAVDRAGRRAPLGTITVDHERGTTAGRTTARGRYAGGRPHPVLAAVAAAWWAADEDAGIEACDYAVEATDFEALCLWREWHERVTWEQESRGVLHTIGHVADMPVCVQLSWNVVAGRRVVFYHASSQVVDHRAVDAWVRAHAMTPRGTHADAMNFHIVAHEIARANEATR